MKNTRLNSKKIKRKKHNKRITFGTFAKYCGIIAITGIISYNCRYVIIKDAKLISSEVTSIAGMVIDSRSPEKNSGALENAKNRINENTSSYEKYSYEKIINNENNSLAENETQYEVFLDDGNEITTKDGENVSDNKENSSANLFNEDWQYFINGEGILENTGEIEVAGADDTNDENASDENSQGEGSDNEDESSDNSSSESESTSTEGESGESSQIETESSSQETESLSENETEVVEDGHIILDGIYDVLTENYELVGLKKGPEDLEFTSAVIPAKVKIIGEGVFSDYKYLEEITFAEGSKLKTIKDNAFRECTSLKMLTLPLKVKTIGQYAFMRCISLETITLPEGLQEISYRAFENCENLKTLTIPSTVTTANQILGKNSGIETVTFAKGGSYIPTAALMNSTNLKKVVMSRGIKVIRKNAFYGCTSLKKVTAPKSLLKINKNAFRDCESLSKYTIRPLVYYIGANAFRDCYSLEKMTLTKTVMTIGSGAFSGDSNLTLYIWANSKAKTYAIKNKVKWDYSLSEKERRAISLSARKKLLKNSYSGANKYRLKYLKNYVPQGVCNIGKYIVVSSYRNGLKSRSILMVYNKKGKFIKMVYLPCVDHVGSLSCIKGKLCVSINNISSSRDYLGVISYKKLVKIKNNQTLSFDYKTRLQSGADFTEFDGTYLWAGKSLDSDSCAMCIYKATLKKVKVGKKKVKRLKFTKVKTLRVQRNTQGVAVVRKSKYKREVYLSQSYGVLKDSALYKYDFNIKKDTSLGSADKTYRLPPMLEGITIKGKYMFFVFESGAGKYTTEDEHQTEIRLKKIYKVKLKDISNFDKY